MRDRHPIHTTLSTDAMRVLKRYETEFGSMNMVLERALMGMDKLRFKEKIDAQSISNIIKRVKTGVPGFDELVEGGIPEGFVVVVTGTPGTGKTIFSMQFLMEGLNNNEKCIFFSFEENVEQLVKQSIRFGWDVGEYIDKGYLEIFGLTMLSTEEIIEIFDVFKPKRIVFDSINAFSDTGYPRRFSAWRNILKAIKEKKTTCLAITEKKQGLKVREFDDFDFMSDGILFFDKKQMNLVDHYMTYLMEIQKMRITKTNETPHQFVISEHGIQLRGPSIVKKMGERPLIKNAAERGLSVSKTPEIITSS